MASLQRRRTARPKLMSKSKDIGTRGETKVARFLNERGVKAERRALSGAEDKGDVKILFKQKEEMTLEVKTGKMTVNPSRSQIEEWIRQAVVEGGNAGCSAALVIVRFRRKIEDAEVYIPGSSWHQFMYLDQFAELAVG